MMNLISMMTKFNVINVSKTNAKTSSSIKDCLLCYYFSVMGRHMMEQTMSWLLEFRVPSALFIPCLALCINFCLQSVWVVSVSPLEMYCRSYDGCG